MLVSSVWSEAASWQVVVQLDCIILQYCLFRSDSNNG